VSRPDRAGLFATYLLATPAFVVADVAFDMPIRVAALEGSNLRFLYYLGAMLLGVGSVRRPAFAPWAGMAESSVNLLFLLLSILLPIWNLPDVVLSGGSVEGLLDGTRLANVVLSGSVLTYGFYRHQASAGLGPLARRGRVPRQ
jgi:hypothetical protein